MGTLKYRFLSILFFFVLFLGKLSAQELKTERDYINAYAKHANKLIWHININISLLRKHQMALNSWYSSSQKTTQAPNFVFSENYNEEDLRILLKDKSIKPSNTAFNYQFTLDKLNKQTLLFNTFCESLAEISKSKTKEEYYKKNIEILYQIDQMAGELVDLCYDFSLSCAINYGKEKLPVELDRLKNTVGQAKNVIMAIRENNPTQVKSYLNQLNKSISSSRLDQRLNDLKRVGKFQITEEQLKKYQLQIIEASNQIAFWAEQYLQSNYTEAEVLPILENAILSFNVFEGKAGCSGAYNEMIKDSKADFLFYTEEPMFFIVEESQVLVTKEVTKVEVVQVVKDTVAIVQIKEVEEQIKEPEVVKAVFDAKNINTLDGALPNNIIIMMDVSASMKTTGKLPLLKSSILHLLNIMRPEDRISLLAYSGEAEVLIAGATIANKFEVKNVLDTLHSSGGTDIENGVKLGYETALLSFMKEGNNRIIIATDGEFGVRYTLLKMVQENALSGVVLSVLQFNDTKDYSQNKNLKTLADTGRGSYKTITNSEEALVVLMHEVKKE